jgi:uncharacterized repeat protein (TIGR01451 family)
LSEAVPGDDTEYRITVTNNGPDDVFGAVVSDLFDPELENVSWTCAATTPVPGDLSESDQYGAANTAGDALVASADGRHIYVIGTAGDSVVAFVRDAVPGVSFGSVAVLETELNTINDVSDSGPAVTGMDARLMSRCRPMAPHCTCCRRPQSSPSIASPTPPTRTSASCRSPDRSRRHADDTAATGAEQPESLCQWRRH